jgi:hypothetical protein
MRKVLALLTAGATMYASIVSTSESANAYASWEHPFESIGSYYSQSQGDQECRKRLDFKSTNNSISPFVRGKVQAWDGTNITNPKWVWYHQQYGHCIANT